MQTSYIHPLEVTQHNKEWTDPDTLTRTHDLFTNTCAHGLRVTLETSSQRGFALNRQSGFRRLGRCSQTRCLRRQRVIKRTEIKEGMYTK